MVANIFSTIGTKFYQRRRGFVDDVTKTFSVLGFAAAVAVFLEKGMLSFTR